MSEQPTHPSSPSTPLTTPTHPSHPTAPDLQHHHLPLLDGAQSPSNAKTQMTGLQNELATARWELSKERKRRHAAEEQVRDLRRESTLNQIRVEEEEEMISNKLMKRLSELKQEKEQIARASESDSEWVTNSLSQRLEELQMQKHKIIAAAEEENEFIVNRLNKELEALRTEKLELERKVQRLSRSTTPGAVTPTSSPALSFRSVDNSTGVIVTGPSSSTGNLSRNGSYRLSAGSSHLNPTNPTSNNNDNMNN